MALHTTEGILRAADLRAWAKWPGSSHASADADGVLLDGPADGFVSYDRASWTLRSGNPVSDNIELCGFAKWTRADWLARPRLCEQAAVWLARRHRARPWIPLVKLTPAEVRAGKAGVIGHNDWTVGMKDGTHWDPGPGFPWDVVLARANALASNTSGSPITTLPVQEDDMPYSEADLVRIVRQAVWLDSLDGVNARDRLIGVDNKTEGIGGQVWTYPTSGKGVQAQDRLTGIDTLVQAVAAGRLTAADVAAALAPTIRDAIATADLGGASADEVADRVADKLAARLVA